MDRRKFCMGGVVLATGAAFPMTSQAFLGPLVRLLFSGTIRRAATRQTGRILASALRNGSRSGISTLGAVGAVSAGMWGVIGAVELKHLWNEGQIQNLLSREPDLTVTKSGAESDVSVEFLANKYDGDVTEIMAQTLVIPDQDLRKQNNVSIEGMIIGQSILEPGEILSLAENLPTREMNASRYVVVPQIIDMNNPEQDIDFDFGFSDNAAILELKQG